MGNAALIVAAIAGAAASGSAALGRLRLARALGVVLVAGAVAATAVLVAALARFDLSLVYVASQSRARSGNAYRFAALWGGAEGSLLLFAAMAGLALLWATWRQPGASTALGRWGLGVGTATVTLIVITVLIFANPFVTESLPRVRGAGLTPILEHPAMLYHPPILYSGLVVTLVGFLRVIDQPSSALAANVDGLRRPAMLAWTLLTVGLATGANWAYVEVGWGGYWAWDPVENTVLMPWLLLTAGIHLLRGPTLRAWLQRTSMLILALPFVFVAFGTATTRSGGLSSVHAFADASALAWMLGALVVLLVAVVVTAVVRLDRDQPRLAEASHTTTRDRLVGLSALVSVFVVVVVLMGVGLPLLPGFDRVVTADYYNRVGAPVLVLALVLLICAPQSWKFASWTRVALESVTVAGFAVAGALVFGVRGSLTLMVIAAAAAVASNHLSHAPTRRMATVLGHIGFVVLALGIAGSAAASSVTVLMDPGDVENFGSDLAVTYISNSVSEGPRFESEEVSLELVVAERSTGAVIATLTPGLINYPNRAVVLAETALHSTPQRDIQIVAQTVARDGAATLELSERPALMLVWWGSALIAIAGAWALWRSG